MKEVQGKPVNVNIVESDKVRNSTYKMRFLCIILLFTEKLFFILKIFIKFSYKTVKKGLKQL